MMRHHYADPDGRPKLGRFIQGLFFSVNSSVHHGEFSLMIAKKYSESIGNALVNTRMFSTMIANPANCEWGVSEALKEAVYFQMTMLEPEWRAVYFSDIPEDLLDGDIPKKAWMMDELNYPESRGFQLALTLKDPIELWTLQKIIFEKRRNLLTVDEK